MIAECRLVEWNRRGSGHDFLRLVLSVMISSAAAASAASDLQAATDEAAVKAKAGLCIAIYELERPRQSRSKAEIQKEVSGREKEFFAFHDGKMKSARFLDPAVFSRGQIGPLRAYEVQQIVSRDELHATIGRHRFVLRGISTEDMAVGQSFSSKVWWRVSGTETYDTVAGGTNTVFVLEPAGDSVPRVEASRNYPWYGTKNEVVVTGEFKRIEGPKAVFRVGEHEQSVPLSKFAKGDRALIRLLWSRENASPSGK